MISLEERKGFIETQSWYQTIEFDEGISSKGCGWCGDPAWNNIVKLLPERLDGMRILDLGCNAGIFCVRSSLLGASECIGIDSNDWKKNVDYLKQALFVKQFFENKYDRKLNISFIKEKIEDYLQRTDIGIFDYCYAIASLYYTANPDFVIECLSRVCKNVIARIRDASRIEMLTKLFEKYSFKLVDVFQERWWEKLNQPTDDFYLYHYVRR